VFLFIHGPVISSPRDWREEGYVTEVTESTVTDIGMAETLQRSMHGYN